MAPPTINLRKALREVYTAPADEFVEIHVPPMTYLSVDGSGDPNTSSSYATALALLYSTAYAIRAAYRTRTGTPFVVGPLEGLWTADDPASFVNRKKDQWRWSMLLPLPPEVTPQDIAEGERTAAVKKPDLPHDTRQVRELHEGWSLQTLHIGPYDDEGPALARLHHEIMPSRGVTFNGPHHEIYLSDPRRTSPAKLRTILRQPVTSTDPA